MNKSRRKTKNILLFLIESFVLVKFIYFFFDKFYHFAIGKLFYGPIFFYNLTIFSKLALSKYFWWCRPKVNKRRVYWGDFDSSNILALVLFSLFKGIVFFKNAVQANIFFLDYIPIVGRVKNWHKCHIDMWFDLNLWIKLAWITVHSLLYLFFILVVKMKPNWFDFFIVLKAVKENDASSTVHHRAYPVFYLSLIIFQLSHSQEDL